MGRIQTKPFRKTLLAGMASSLAIMAAAPGALAQEARGEAAAQSFSLPAGPLGDALFAVTTAFDVNIIADERLIQGKTAPAVSGVMSADEALERLLAGSGLVVTRSASGAYVIAQQTVDSRNSGDRPIASAPIDGAPLVADTILVEGSRYFEPETPLTRAPISIQELPNSLTVINREILQDQAVVNFDDALLNVAGVQQAGSEIGIRSSNTLSLRGIQDGAVPTIIRENSLSGGVVYAPDPYSIERIEVIKGPAAIAGGGAPVGGLINRVLKTANRGVQNEAIFIGDTFGEFRAGVDLNGDLTGHDKVYGRLVVAGSTGDQPSDLVSEDTLQITPSIFIDASDKTSLLLQANYFTRDGAPLGGLTINPDITDSDLEPDFNWLYDPDGTELDQEHFSVQADLVHRFLDDLTLTARAGYSESDNFAVTVYSFSYLPGGLAETGDINIYAGSRDDFNQRFAADIYLRKDFSFGGLKESSILIGADFVDQSSDSRGTFQLLGSDNTFNPQNFFEVPADIAENFEFRNTSAELQQAGVYGQAILRIVEGLTAVGAVRYDTFNQASVFSANLVQLGGFRDGNIDDSQDAVTWRFGASYEFGFNTTVYGGYSESFLNNAFRITVNGDFIELENGQQFEVGLKGSYFDDRLSVTVSAFDIERLNVASPDPQNQGFFVADAAQSIRGIEVEAVGEISPGLDIVAAYTLFDGEIADDGVPDEQGPGFEGAELRSISRHQLSLFGNYEVQSGRLAGLGIGGRVFHRSSRPILEEIDSARIDGFTTFDLTLFYKNFYRDFDARLYVQNVTDELFLATSDGLVFNTFGAGRNARFSIATQF